MTVESNVHIEHLIEQLQTRELTQAEWEQLDTYAKEDPFLSDALDGLRQLPHNKRSEHLASIKARIESQKPARRRIAIYKWGAAAAVMAVLVIALVFRDQFAPPETGALAEVEKVVTDAPLAEQSPPVEEDLQISARNAEQAEQEAAFESSNLPRRIDESRDIPNTAAPAPIANNSVEERAQPSAKPETDQRTSVSPDPSGAYPSGVETAAPIATDDTRSQKSATRSDRAQLSPMRDPDSSNPNAIVESPKPSDEDVNEIALQSAEEPREMADTQLASNPIRITGMITDEHADPIVGAQVALSGSKLGTNTDFDGKYTLVIPDGEFLDNADLMVSYLGYQPKTIDIKDRRNIDVVLENGVELSEVVVTGADKKQPKTKKNAGPRNPAYALASPIDGWKEYYKYIRKEIKTPAEAKEADIEGTVGLEFNLDQEGIPTDIRIVQSLGYGCDEEAIRLLREGPRWDVASAQVPIGRIEIDF